MTLAECGKKVDEALNEFLETLPHHSLNEPIRYVMGMGGKRMRPALALMSCSLFSDDVTLCVKPALGIELFHNFTLLHDDVMDNAPVRRNKPTVHKKWNTSAAILSGDAMLIHAYDLMCSVPHTYLPELLRLFNSAALAVCNGQQLDMDFEKRTDVNEWEYINMISQKTSVLLGAALQTGALLGGAGHADQQHLYELGVDMGIAFQLMDDYLDAFGDENLVGKKRGGDIRSGKKTYLLICAMEKATGDDKAQLMQLMNEENPETKVTGVINLFEKLHVRSNAENKMNEYNNLALQHLEKVNVSSSKKESLRLLAEELLVRQH
ncbi:MAG: polyprenyl synthetase family protein [Flavobacteriales bacterium]|nr:polyprenyl synthetase family protein [Flavobacteriales bacterium]